METDIIVCTHNRPELLKRTLDHLFERTTSPYRLHVIDDASTAGNAEYLSQLWAEGRLASLLSRREARQFAANWNIAPWIAQSEILVFSDDDILCPRLEPDWLARGLAAMAKYPRIGMLAPNCPSQPPAIHDDRRLGPVMICDKLGTTLTLIRRAPMRQIVIPPNGTKLAGITVFDDGTHLATAWARAMRAQGLEVGYMVDVYCQHIGAISARNSQDLSARMVEPSNPDTLEP